MNISRGEVSEFHYSSSLPASKQTIVPVGTADSNNLTIRITDLKMTCGTPGRTVKFYMASAGAAGTATYPQTMEFDIPSYSVVDFSWDMPYKIPVVTSTSFGRPFVGSASGVGVKYSISGYTEK